MAFGVSPDQMLHPNLLQVGEFSPTDCSSEVAANLENATTMTEPSLVFKSKL
jgi:hypothetical protein